MGANLLPGVACCCAGGSENPCTHCDDKTPVDLTATFSGITVCTACYVIGAGPVSYKMTTPAPTPVGPYTLAQVGGSPCLYRYQGSIVGEWQMFTSPTCPGTGTKFPFIDLLIEATFTAGNIAISGWWTHQTGGPMAMYGPQSFFFGQNKAQAVCDGPFSLNNAYAACNTSGPTYAGHSGSVSIVSNF